MDAAGVIGGYVSISIIVVALITFFSSKSLNQTTKKTPKWSQPFIGAFLGVIPGCGGTIVASSLYKKKKITFGGLLAAFITTLGEGSFVLLGASNEADVAGNLQAYITITIFGLISGFIFGYLFDILGFRANFKNNKVNYKEDHKTQIKQSSLVGLFVDKIGFYAIILMAIFLAPGSIMALWGGGIDSIAGLTYWVSILLTITCIIF